jgi:hypothetical protein
VVAGKVQATLVSPFGNFLQSIRYGADDKMYVNNDIVIPTSDPWTQGMRFDPNGALHVWDVETNGMPSNIDYDSGMPVTLFGHLMVTSLGVVVRYNYGWPLDVRGFVCMTNTGAAPVAPGAFTFTVTKAVETPITVTWATSTNATTYQIRRDSVLVQTVSGTTPSTSNPQIFDWETVPAAPVAPTAVAGNTTATVTWVAPADGNAPIEGYNIQAFVAGVPGAVQSATASPYVFTGLTNGTAYTFRVAASNFIGQGPYSPDSNAVTPSGAVMPTAVFDAPLLNTLVPTVAVNGSYVFSRSSLAYSTDNEGVLRSMPLNGARFRGARRIQNKCTESQSPYTNWGILAGGMTITPGVTDPLGGTTAATFTAATATASRGFSILGGWALGNYVNSLWVRRRTGVGTVEIANNNSTYTDITAQLTGAWKRFSSTIGFVINTNATYSTGAVRLAVSGDAVDIAFAQCELVSGQSNQVPGTYVRNMAATDAPPFFGAGVNGVQYFTTVNANTVAAGVVTEVAGAAIPAATLLGYTAERQATNILLQSQSFNTTWVNQSMTVTADNAVAPDGSQTADTLTATANPSSMDQAWTAAGATPYTFSVYMKRTVGSGIVGITVDDNVFINIESLINSVTWTRVSQTATPASGARTARIRLSNPTDAVAVWGAQLEASPEPTSYILTTNAAQTRLADTLSYPISNLSCITGSAYSEFWKPYSSGANNSTLYTVAFDSRSPLRINTTPSLLSTNPLGQSVAPNNFVPNAVNVQKSAASWSAATCSISYNGGTVGTGTFSPYTNSDSINLGGGTNDGLGGSMRNARLYDVRLTDPQLVTITT